MPRQPAPEVKLLRAAYTAFNARDIEAALATICTMTAAASGRFSFRYDGPQPADS